MEEAIKNSIFNDLFAVIPSKNMLISFLSFSRSYEDKFLANYFGLDLKTILTMKKKFIELSQENIADFENKFIQVITNFKNREIKTRKRLIH